MRDDLYDIRSIQHVFRCTVAHAEQQSLLLRQQQVGNTQPSTDELVIAVHELALINQNELSVFDHTSINSDVPLRKSVMDRLSELKRQLLGDLRGPTRVAAYEPPSREQVVKEYTQLAMLMAEKAQCLAQQAWQLNEDKQNDDEGCEGQPQPLISAPLRLQCRTW